MVPETLLREGDVTGLDLQFGEFVEQTLNVGFAGAFVGQSQALDSGKCITNGGGVGGDNRFIQNHGTVVFAVSEDVSHVGGYLEVQTEHGLVNFQQERFELVAAGACEQSLFLQGLFQGACESTAVLAGTPPEQRLALRSFGRHLGIAFQLIDDYLDYQGDASALGKNVGDDLAELGEDAPPGERAVRADIERGQPAAGSTVPKSRVRGRAPRPRSHHA